MNHLFFKVFVGICLVFGLSGCIFSWKPSIENSSVNVSDSTTQEASYETTKEE